MSKRYSICRTGDVVYRLSRRIVACTYDVAVLLFENFKNVEFVPSVQNENKIEK